LLDSKIESVPRPVPFQMLRYGSREARWNVDEQSCLYKVGQEIQIWAGIYKAGQDCKVGYKASSKNLCKPWYLQIYCYKNLNGL